MNVDRGSAPQWRTRQDPATGLFTPTADPQLSSNSKARIWWSPPGTSYLMFPVLPNERPSSTCFALLRSCCLAIG